MSQHNTYGRSSKYLVSFALLAASILGTLAVQATEPEPNMSAEERDILGVNEDQAQAIANARAKRDKKSYSEKEQTALDLAITAVNERTELPEGTIHNVRIRAMEWPDSSLGCAKPGVDYLQQIVPGYIVVLVASEEVYTVHIGSGTAVVCDQITDYMRTRGDRGMTLIKVFEAARIDLANRLKIEPDQVEVTNIKTMTWTDSSLGCRTARIDHEEVSIEGFVINLTCRGRKYEYRTDSEAKEFVACEELVSCHETE